MKEISKEILQELYQALLAVKDFAIEQAPLVIQELLKFNLILNLFGWIGCLLVVIVGLYLGFKVFYERTEGISAIFCMFLLFPIIGGIFSFVTWLKILIAPRVYLIEYLGDLIK